MFAQHRDDIDVIDKTPPISNATFQINSKYFDKVSERSERAFWKTSILAMKCAKWLQTATSTTKLTHPIRVAPSSLGAAG